MIPIPPELMARVVKIGLPILGSILIFVFGFMRGVHHMQAELDEYKRIQAIADAKASATLETTNKKVEALQSALNTSDKKVTELGVKANETDQKNRDLQQRLANATVRVFVPTRQSNPAEQAGNSATSGLGQGQPSTAELDPAFASILAGIAADGDYAIKQRDACVIAYDKVKELSDLQGK